MRRAPLRGGSHQARCSPSWSATGWP